MKVGDNVRFLNAVGGGRVVRIDGSMAYVEEDDGFETPVLARECVVIAAASPLVTPGSAAKPAPVPKAKEAPVLSKYDAPAPKSSVAEVPMVELPGGDVINAVIGFEPQNIKTLSTSNFDAYFVNDSNYRLFVTVATRSSIDREWICRFDGLIEPNMQEFLWELEQADLARTDRMLVQLVAFKRDRPYEARQPISMEIKMDATKFVRLHCFRPHRYFDGPVLSYNIVHGGTAAVQFEPDAQEIRKGMSEKLRSERSESRRPESRSSKPLSEPVVVDLHASELLDSTAGLSSADILNMQVDRFRSVMDQYRRNAGQKIVFIHGKGEGVLRQAIMKELNNRYKGHDVQDASFAEYGFGATQVTIRPNAQPQQPKRFRR